jgi:hypothetical protein
VEIRLSTDEAMEIIAKHFKSKGYELDGCLPIVFEKKENNIDYFSILVKFNIDSSVSF